MKSRPCAHPDDQRDVTHPRCLFVPFARSGAGKGHCFGYHPPACNPSPLLRFSARPARASNANSGRCFVWPRLFSGPGVGRAAVWVAAALRAVVSLGPLALLCSAFGVDDRSNLIAEKVRWTSSFGFCVSKAGRAIQNPAGVWPCRVWCGKKGVKSADTPDSVRGGCPLRDRHLSGPGVARPARCHLPAHSAGRFNVCLLGVAARRDCPFHPN